MEPYKPNEPFIKLKLDGSLLDRMVEAGIPLTRAIQYFRDNPEAPAMETLKLAAEDVIPFYGTYRNDGDWSDYAKEAALLGVPMPYIKHPKTGKPIPNNLKEGLGNKGWGAVKYGWNHNKSPRLLYTEETLPNKSVPRSGLSTRSRVGATADAREAIDIPAGPYRETNTGSNFINRGQQAVNSNTISRSHAQGTLSGERGWQGEMYPPGRRLRNDEMYGPYQWEDKYSRKLDAVIDENEYKWEYLINKTRQPGTIGRAPTIIPKQDIVNIALNQGRPDIAERVMLDNKPRLGQGDDTRMKSYNSSQVAHKLTDERWKDIGNRQVEKELRETFASLPNDPDIRYRFAEHYGVPDLYQSWLNDPLPWDKLKAETEFKRIHRERSNRSNDRRYGRTIQR